ncbi:M23 family metallopeptidase [Streptomyces albiaxialis]|uniref:M23 family metallopeptidase n=1 Tax=Streptomyces albiaxialis TaxID=329523 RepID=UPI0031D04B9C
MNDRHPSGVPSPDDPGSDFSYTAYSTDYGQSNYGAPAYGNGDPLFGAMPGSYDQQAADGQTSGYGYPVVDDGTGQWTFGVQETTSWGTGTWEASPWGADQTGQAGQPGQAGMDATAAAAAAYGYEGGQGGYDAAYTGYEQQSYGTHDTYAAGYGAYVAYGQDASGQWNFSAAHEYDTASTWGFPDTAGPQAAAQAPAEALPEQQPMGHGAAYEGYETPSPYEQQDRYEPEQYEPEQYGPEQYGPEGHEHAGGYEPGPAYDPYDGYEADQGHGHSHSHDSGPDDRYDDHYDDGYEPGGGPDTATLAAVPQPRGRRRSPKPRRRALLTVAVPSVAVLGVAGAAAASVLGGGSGGDGKSGGEEPPAQAAGDTEPTEVKPSQANTKLDTQLAGLSADADDFADRASRTQERIDLKERQRAEKERKAKEAARKEAMRPKYMIPVKDHQLSARYGQAGMNWMSVHTGIDFPVSYGTPVMAATDGTVSTKYDMSYGNMAVVTAKDGTETWYCHLSSNKIRSGEVKAGDTIAYSGNSGNSTGPHLHFEVRPGGGSAVDPIPWLQDKGLEIS